MSFGVDPRSFTITLDTTAPTGANTVTLFNSVTAFGGAGRMRHLPCARISLGINNDQACTLNAAESTDGGATWRTFSSTVLAAPAANTINGPYDYLIDVYHELRIQVVNGGVTQTTWELMCKGHENRAPGI